MCIDKVCLHTKDQGLVTELLSEYEENVKFSC